MKLQFQYYRITNIEGESVFVVLPHEKWIPFAANTAFDKHHSIQFDVDYSLSFLHDKVQVPINIKSVDIISQKEYQKLNGGINECIYTYNKEYYNGILPDYYDLWETINDCCCSGFLTDLIGYIDDLERIYVENNIFDNNGLEMLYNHMTGIDPAAIIESATRQLYGICLSTE